MSAPGLGLCNQCHQPVAMGQVSLDSRLFVTIGACACHDERVIQVGGPVMLNGELPTAKQLAPIKLEICPGSTARPDWWPEEWS